MAQQSGVTESNNSLLGGQRLEAVILAGGLGTRLRSAVPDLPKCMAPINGKPFIAYVIEYFRDQGIENFILSIGYMHELVIQFVNEQYSTLDIQYSIEDDPLGTGGAIKLACKKSKGKNIIATNGDTLFEVNISRLNRFHSDHNAECTLSLKPMKDFDRYGVVELNKDNSIKRFKEKQYYKEGFINGGLYALNVAAFLNADLPEKFSFEKDYLEKLFFKRRMFGCVQDEYFIDIGIPEDYERAQLEFESKKIKNIHDRS